MKRLLPVLLLLASCTSSHPAVKAPPPGPDHLGVLHGSDLGPGWHAVEPAAVTGCLHDQVANLPAEHVETVAYEHGSDVVTQEVRTVRSSDANALLTAAESACKATVDRSQRYGPGLLTTPTAVLAATDSGYVLLSVRGSRDVVQRASDAYRARLLDWQHSRVQAAYETWKAKGSTSYTMDLIRGCFCDAGTFQVTVASGAVKGVTQEVDVVQPLRDGQTIDSIFEQLLKVDQGGYSVQFDPTYGYPTTLSVDPLPNAIDDEYGLKIQDYQPA